MFFRMYNLLAIVLTVKPQIDTPLLRLLWTLSFIYRWFVFLLLFILNTAIFKISLNQLGGRTNCFYCETTLKREDRNKALWTTYLQVVKNKEERFCRKPLVKLYSVGMGRRHLVVERQGGARVPHQVLPAGWTRGGIVGETQCAKRPAGSICGSWRSFPVRSTGSSSSWSDESAFLNRRVAELFWLGRGSHFLWEYCILSEKMRGFYFVGLMPIQ